MNLLARPLAPSDYRALVCVFLDGGNDSNNMVVPTDPATTASTSPRDLSGRASGSTRPRFRPINVPAGLLRLRAHVRVPPVASRDGGAVQPEQARGGHERRAARRARDAVGHRQRHEAAAVLAVLALRPDPGVVDRPRPTSGIATGWGGRTADATLDRATATPGSRPVTSIDGAATFCVGIAQNPLAIDTGALDQVLVPERLLRLARRRRRGRARWTSRARSTGRRSSSPAASDVTQQAVDISSALSVDPTLTTVFPDTGPRRAAPPGRQGHQAQPDVAAAVAEPADLLRDAGRLRHAPGPGDGPRRPLAELSARSTRSTPRRSSWASRTASRRSRCRTSGRHARAVRGPGLRRAPDHGWASHQFIVGGAVNGGNFYGTRTA
jgi:hypothetical protein